MQEIALFFAEVAEWQTRRFQVPVIAISCGFNSHLLHQRKNDTRMTFRHGGGGVPRNACHFWGEQWQTRRFQVPVVEIPCGFNSHLSHQSVGTNKKMTRIGQCSNRYFLFFPTSPFSPHLPRLWTWLR